MENQPGTGWRAHAGPIAVLLVATIALTWPLVARLTGDLPAFPRVRDDDLLSNIWSLWWTRASLLDGRGELLWTNHLFHPEGITLTLTALSPATSLFLLPVLIAVPGTAGIILAWNLNVLATFFLSGAAVYALAYRVTGAPWPSLVAGFAFAFSPYRYDHLRHINLSCTQWLPLVFLGLVMRLEGGGWRGTLMLAGAATLVATSSMTYAGQLPVIGAIWLAGWLVTQEDRRAAFVRALKALPVPVALAALLSAPVALPTLFDMATMAHESPVWEDPVRFAYPIEGFVFGPLHPYAGMVAVLLAVYAGLRVRTAAPWLAVAVFGLMLAPGPELKTMAGESGFPLPYALIRHVPTMGQNRFTERFMLFWWLGASVLGALALTAWRPAVRAPRRWALAFCAVMALDMRHVPLELERPPVPPVYHELRTAPAGWPVYEYPATFHSNRWFMYYQTIHQRPICQGVVSRRPLVSYQAEETDALSPLPAMVFIEHARWQADGHIRKKREYLFKRYDASMFHEDGETKAWLLRLKTERTGR